MPSDTDRINWLFGLGERCASRQQIEEILMHTVGPDEARGMIDEMMAPRGVR